MSLINGFINKFHWMRIATLLAVVLISACSSQKANEYDSFGAKISTDGAIGLDELLMETAKSDSLDRKIVATIDEVCQSKGCWMTLATGNQKVRVTFKDYGFFVPKDAAGREVILAGVVVNKELDEELAGHYAEDAGKEFTPDMLNEVSIVASGVLIKKEAQL